MSATDINNVRPILEWARHSENEEVFLAKINTAIFSSAAKRTKLEVFKTHLKTANNGTDVSNKQLWEFLKVFHLIGYDLDTESGNTLPLLFSLISMYSNEAAVAWEDLVYNFARPLKSLRVRVVDDPKRTWKPHSPAMAAGLTDHIWTVKELLKTVASPSVNNT